MFMEVLNLIGAKIFRCFCVTAFFLCGCLVAHARPGSGGEIVYDNTVHSSNFGLPVIGEIGDEITLGGAGRNITDVQFEYYGKWTNEINAAGQLHFYLNDGDIVDAFGSRAPKTVFWESPLFNVSSGYGSIGIHDLNVAVPNNFTVSVQFFGLKPQEEGQILLYDPPSVGSSYRDYWQKNGSIWGLFVTDGFRDNFGLRLTAAGGINPLDGIIHFEQVQNRLRLSWTGAGYRLQQTSALNSSVWSDVAFSSNSASVLIGTENRFFRLINGQVDGTLKAQLLGGQIQITWPGTGYILQQSDVANDPAGWTDVASNANAATLNIGAGNKFFRLRKP